MIRNTPKNSVVPSMKHDMAKRLMSSKGYVKTPEGGGRRKVESDRGGKLVWGLKHGNSSKQMTDKKDKHFTRGAMGAQESQTKSPSKAAGGWEISHE